MQDELMTANDLKELLDTEARRINNPDFIGNDPVQFPRRFSDLRDIEIASLLCATISWGNRKMICKNCDKMLSLMDNSPYLYVMDKGYEELPDMNIHRTFFAKNLRHFLRGLNEIYSRFDSISDFAAHEAVSQSEFPAWKLVEALNRELRNANDNKEDSRCLPGNLDATALKRVNMALRWLVRNDGIVDMGVWNIIKPAQLYIPLDVHVGNTARELGLLNRKANDKKSVVELTTELRRMRPEDPVYYDYALFGIGIEKSAAAVD